MPQQRQGRDPCPWMSPSCPSWFTPIGQSPWASAWWLIHPHTASRVRLHCLRAHQPRTLLNSAFCRPGSLWLWYLRELPALGQVVPRLFESGLGGAEHTTNGTGLSLPLLVFLLLRSPGDEHLLLLFPKGIHNVEGIAVDWMGNNLYWTDDGPKKTISVARLEKAAQTRKTLIEGKMTHPRAIVVDPLNGCGCLGGQGWLMGGHGHSCPQQGLAELAVGFPAPHGLRVPRCVSERSRWLPSCDSGARWGSSSSCGDGSSSALCGSFSLGLVALAWLGGPSGRCIGLGPGCRHKAAGPPCCFVSAALRAAGEFTPASVEAKPVALQISSGLGSEPSSSASVTA